MSLRDQVAILQAKLSDLAEEKLAARRIANGAASVLGWKLALRIAEEHGVPQKGRGRLVHRISGGVDAVTGAEGVRG